MKRFSLSSCLVLAIMATGIFWASCGKKPAPGPSTDELARQARERARQDSLRAVDEAARLARAAEEEARRRAAAEEEARRKAAAEEEARRRAGMDEEAQRVGMLNPVYFDFDRFNIRNDQKPALDEDARKLRDYRPEDRVTIEGYCDERGTVEYNLALGERRASTVKKYLVDAGIKANRINTISYGEERPAVMGSNESAWSKNRRAELKRQQ